MFGDNAQNMIIGTFIIDKMDMSKHLPAGSANKIYFKKSLANNP